MKKMNKKGFTIVELVIVIAVIAILSAVLIPTFSGVVSEAKLTAAMSDARAEYQEYIQKQLTEEKKDVPADADFIYATEDGVVVLIIDGVVTVAYESIDKIDATKYTVKDAENKNAVTTVNAGITPATITPVTE